MKKTLLTLSMLLLMFAAIAQNQISELQKGMVFHAPLSEWYPSKDLVTGITGTATATYPIAGRNGDGANRYYSFNGSSDYVALPTLTAFGTSDFTVILKINVSSFYDEQALIGGTSNSLGITITSSGNIKIYKVGDTAVGTSTQTITIGVDYTIAYKRSGTTGTIYINGIADSGGTKTDAKDYTGVNTRLGYYVGGAPLAYHGLIYMCRIFNYALSSIANYSKPEYPIEYSDRDGAGNLCVLNLAAEGLAKASDGSYNVGYWTDRVNSITATVSGATSVIPPASNLNATYLNGTNGKIVFSNLLDNISQFTISMWYYHMSSASGHQPLFVDGMASNKGVMVSVVTNNPNIYIPNSSYESVSSTELLSINNWYNLTFTYNGSIARVYVNGVLKNSGTLTKVSSSGGSLNLGYWQTSGYAMGQLSDIIVYNRVIDESQIKLLYDLGH